MALLAEYPKNVSSTAFASFLEIERLQYKKGLEKAGGATETLLTSGLAGVLGGIGGGIASLYNIGANNPNSLADEASLSAQNLLGQLQGISPTSLADQSGGLGTAQEQASKYNSIDDIPDSELEKIKLSDGTNLTRDKLKELEQRAALRRNKDGQTINVALPNEMSYGYGASWNNTFKIGTLAGAFNSTRGLVAGAVGVGVGGALGGYLQKQKSKASAGNTDGGKILGAIGAGAAKAANPFGINSDLNPASAQGLTNLAGLAGMAPNENAVQFFSNIEFREFTFDFEIFTPSAADKAIAETLVRFFKQGMHPSAPAGTGVLKFPDVYIIRPKFKPERGSATNHYLLPQSKSCALTNLRVNTTPMNSVQTTYDGTFPLITISVTFKELTALTREDLEKGY